MARRVFLHIGTMKSATTYLQRICDANTERLAANGILWLPSSLNQQASAELLGSARLPEQDRGAWRRLRQAVRAHPGDALVSSELFALLRPPRVQRLVHALDADELRVLITARDLSQIVASHWQETTANRGKTPWKEWVDAICQGPDDVPAGMKFWRHQYLPALVRDWQGVAFEGMIHLVTVPHDRSDPTLLWRRFATVLQNAPTEVVVSPAGNPSLGAVSAELMRRVNVELGAIPFQEYSPAFKRVLAKRVLVRRAGVEPRHRLDTDHHRRITQLATEMVDELRTLDLEVSGTLDDLIPAPRGAAEGDDGFDPGTASDAELLEAAIAGLVGLGRHVSALQRELKELKRHR